MKDALTDLVAGAVDYAGLFPPAALDMDAAVRAYASYLQDGARFMLGRFVVPVVRLREFEDARAGIAPAGDTTRGEPWRLSVLTGPDTTADLALASRFNDRHAEAGDAVIDAVELKVVSRPEIAAAVSRMPRELTPYFEIPVADDPADLVAEIRRGGAYAKVRTGGVTADAFPQPAQLARFLVRCRDAKVGFKLTAGLHHPLRASYPLTYAAGAPRADMFGFLNLYVAAALAWADTPEPVVVAALESRSAHDFHFTDDALGFRGHWVSVDEVRDARTRFVRSFGSCSFREPADELASLSFS
ncbi:MAG TPA: hypothetical protein VGT98_08835 [Candidatus Elarobacter sp.]|nr:hypothetical protein [Candidatus Elarobacter sp.]